MADLVVLGYPDEATAKAVYAEVQELQKDYIIDGTAAYLTRAADGRDPGRNRRPGSSVPGPRRVPCGAL